MESFNKINIRQAKKLILKLLRKNMNNENVNRYLIPYLVSNPGGGKSEVIESIANELNLHLIDHRASTSDPTDYNGVGGIHEGQAKLFQFTDIFPDDTTPIPHGKKGFLLFLDELPNANRSLQAGCYKLMDRKIGQRKLHDKCYIVAAGNYVSSNASAFELTTASRSRLAVMNLVSDCEVWLQDYGLPKKVDMRIITFLKNTPHRIDTFSPKIEESNYACYRTWASVSDAIKDEPFDDLSFPLISSFIGEGLAAEFMQFCEVFSSDKIPSLDGILANPETALIPDEVSIQWATMTTVAYRADEKNIETLLKYVNRYNQSHLFYFAYMANSVNYSLIKNPVFRTTLQKISHYLNG